MKKKGSFDKEWPFYKCVILYKKDRNFFLHRQCFKKISLRIFKSFLILSTFSFNLKILRKKKYQVLHQQISKLIEVRLQDLWATKWSYL